MYLIFDASANGRPKSYKASLDDSFNWPRLIHLSWILLGEDMKPLEDYNCLVKPAGFTADEKMLKFHHIDPEKLHNANAMKDVLDQFMESIGKVDFVFAHNLKYNEGVVGSEYHRMTRPNPLVGADKYCLMHEGTYFCKIPGKKGYKWPTLQEMHTTIFKQGYTPANNARADVIAATRCFIALKRARALEDIFVE